MKNYLTLSLGAGARASLAAARARARMDASTLTEVRAHLAYGLRDGVLPVSSRALLWQGSSRPNVTLGRNHKKALENWPNSEFIGTLRQRDNFFVKLIEIKETSYGSLYIVSTRTGNRGCFWSFTYGDKILSPGYRSAAQVPDPAFWGHEASGTDGHYCPIKVGDCFTIRATPKNHDINNYDGIKDTRFNRVELVSIASAGESKNEV